MEKKSSLLVCESLHYDGVIFQYSHIYKKNLVLYFCVQKTVTVEKSSFFNLEKNSIVIEKSFYFFFSNLEGYDFGWKKTFSFIFARKNLFFNFFYEIYIFVNKRGFYAVFILFFHILFNWFDLPLNSVSFKRLINVDNMMVTVLPLGSTTRNAAQAKEAVPRYVGPQSVSWGSKAHGKFNHYQRKLRSNLQKQLKKAAGTAKRVSSTVTQNAKIATESIAKIVKNKASLFQNTIYQCAIQPVFEATPLRTTDKITEKAKQIVKDSLAMDSLGLSNQSVPWVTNPHIGPIGGPSVRIWNKVVQRHQKAGFDFSSLTKDTKYKEQPFQNFQFELKEEIRTNLSKLEGWAKLSPAEQLRNVEGCASMLLVHHYETEIPEFVQAELIYINASNDHARGRITDDQLKSTEKTLIALVDTVTEKEFPLLGVLGQKEQERTPYYHFLSQASRVPFPSDYKVDSLDRMHILSAHSKGLDCVLNRCIFWRGLHGHATGYERIWCPEEAREKTATNLLKFAQKRSRRYEILLNKGQQQAHISAICNKRLAQFKELTNKALKYTSQTYENDIRIFKEALFQDKTEEKELISRKFKLLCRVSMQEGALRQGTLSFLDALNNKESPETCKTRFRDGAFFGALTNGTQDAQAFIVAHGGDVDCQISLPLKSINVSDVVWRDEACFKTYTKLAKDNNVEVKSVVSPTQTTGKKVSKIKVSQVKISQKEKAKTTKTKATTTGKKVSRIQNSQDSQGNNT